MSDLGSGGASRTRPSWLRACRNSLCEYRLPLRPHHKMRCERSAAECSLTQALKVSPLTETSTARPILTITTPFTGTSPAALDVIGQLAGQYISNFGRTLRFYADRYSGALDNSVGPINLLSLFCRSANISHTRRTQQILCRSLSENGVPTPDHLRAYVADDVDRYGSRLSDLLGRLERTRAEQLEAVANVDPAEQVRAEESLFANDGEAFVAGDFAARIGEDFFALAEQGLDQELNMSTLVVPRWMLRGDPRPLDSEATR
jgi:transcriptional activator SPT7